MRCNKRTFLALLPVLVVVGLVAGMIIAIHKVGGGRVTSSILNVVHAISGGKPGLTELVFSLAICCSALICIPGVSILMIITGLLFGMGIGFLISYVGLLGSAGASFVIGRYLLQRRVTAGLSEFSFWRKLNYVISRDGFRMLCLMNCICIPLFVKNYGPSVIPSVTFKNFILSTALVSAPHVALYCLIGSSASSFVAVASVSGWKEAGLRFWVEVGGVILSVIATVVLVTWSYRMFRAIELPEEDSIELPDDSRIQGSLAIPSVSTVQSTVDSGDSRSCVATDKREQSSVSTQITHI